MRAPWWATRPRLALVIAGCGGVPADGGRRHRRGPDVPVGWRTVTTDEGDVEATIPRGFVVTGTTGAISGYPEVDAPPSASWMVIGPATHELRSGQTIEDWIDGAESSRSSTSAVTGRCRTTFPRFRPDP